MFTPNSSLRRAPWSRRLAALLTLVLACPPLSTLLPTAQAQNVPVPASMTPGGIRSVLLFPSAATSDAAGLTTQLDNAIKLRLGLVGNYTPKSFTKFDPSVQRALDEADATSGLTDADIKSPFGSADLARAQKVATVIGTDSFLLTNIQSSQQDATTRRVTLLASSRLYDTRTGNPVPGLGGVFSGAAAPTSSTDTDAAIQQAAINDVAGKIASSLNSTSAHPRTIVAADSQRGSNHSAQTALLVVLGGALLYAILSGSHFSSGGGSNNSSSTTSGTTTSGLPPSPPTVTTAARP